jgi:hypothetical protein
LYLYVTKLKERGSERQKSEHRKVRTSKVFLKDDHNVERSEHRKSERRKERQKRSERQK